MPKIENRLQAVEQMPLKTHADHRGYLLKAIENHFVTGHGFGEIYFVESGPGVIRANHYHKIATEWFVPIKGNGILGLVDPGFPNQKLEIKLESAQPICVKIPAGVAHGLLSTGDHGLLLMALADKGYDPNDTDTYPYVVFESKAERDPS